MFHNFIKLRNSVAIASTEISNRFLDASARIEGQNRELYSNLVFDGYGPQRRGHSDERNCDFPDEEGGHGERREGGDERSQTARVETVQTRQITDAEERDQRQEKLQKKKKKKKKKTSPVPVNVSNKSDRIISNNLIQMNKDTIKVVIDFFLLRNDSGDSEESRKSYLSHGLNDGGYNPLMRS